MVAQTTTWLSGGYRLPLAASAYQIKMVNAVGGVMDKGTVQLTTENVKLDSRTPVFTTPPGAGVNLRITQSGNAAHFTWDDPTFSLASSGNDLSGPWTVVATASPAAITIQPGRRFFRCQK